jgi:hypothetical protein
VIARESLGFSIIVSLLSLPLSCELVAEMLHFPLVEYECVNDPFLPSPPIEMLAGLLRLVGILITAKAVSDGKKSSGFILTSCDVW